MSVHFMVLQAEVLRLGGSDVKLFYLELLDNNIGPRGANALGASLSYGHNLSLLTLKLDFNQSLGNDGKFPDLEASTLNQTDKVYQLLWIFSVVPLHRSGESLQGSTHKYDSETTPHAVLQHHRRGWTTYCRVIGQLEVRLRID